MPELLAVAAVAVGGACHSATGFGFGLVAAPLVVAALPAATAVSTLLALGILISLLTLATEGRRPAPLWAESATLVGWGAAGALAGALLLARLDDAALQLLVSAAVVAALASRWLARSRAPARHAQRWVAPAGLAAGALTTTTTTNAPPLLLYLFGRGVRASAMRDTLSVLFVGFGAIGLVALAVGEAGPAFPEPAVVAALAAAAAAGQVAGRPVFARLAAGHYDQVVAGLLLVSVVTGGIVALG